MWFVVKYFGNVNEINSLSANTSSAIYVRDEFANETDANLFFLKAPRPMYSTDFGKINDVNSLFINEFTPTCFSDSGKISDFNFLF